MKTCCRSFWSHQDVQKGVAVLFGLVIGTYLGILSMSQPLFRRTWTHYFRLPGVGPRGDADNTASRTYPPFRNPEAFTAASAQKLLNSTRLTCFLDESKIDHINQSWGPKCNNFHNLYINTTKNKIPSAFPNVLQTLITSFGNLTDWFVKANSKTFLLPENVRHLVQNESTIHPIVYKTPKKGVLWDSVFLFNRAAAEKMTAFCRPLKLLRNKWDMTPCLRSSNVTIRDLKDGKGRDVVIPHSPRFWFGNLKETVKKAKQHQRLIPSHVSDYPIAFQNMDRKQILVSYLFVYRIRPAGKENEKRRRGDIKNKMSINAALKLNVKIEIVTKTSKPQTSAQTTANAFANSNGATVKATSRQTATNGPNRPLTSPFKATIIGSTATPIAITSSMKSATIAPSRPLTSQFQPNDRGGTTIHVALTSLDSASKTAVTSVSNRLTSTRVQTTNKGSTISPVAVTSPGIASTKSPTSASNRPVSSTVQPKNMGSTQLPVAVTSSQENRISSSGTTQEPKTPLPSVEAMTRIFNSSILQPTVPRSYRIF